MVTPHWTGLRDLSCSTIHRQVLLRKTLVPPLVPARGALVACLTGLITLTSTRIYNLHFSTYTRVPGSVSIHILRTVVLDYGELLAYWFILHLGGQLEDLDQTIPQRHYPWHADGAPTLLLAAQGPPVLTRGLILSCRKYHGV